MNRPGLVFLMSRSSYKHIIPVETLCSACLIFLRVILYDTQALCFTISMRSVGIGRRRYVDKSCSHEVLIKYEGVICGRLELESILDIMLTPIGAASDWYTTALLFNSDSLKFRLFCYWTTTLVYKVLFKGWLKKMLTQMRRKKNGNYYVILP